MKRKNKIMNPEKQQIAIAEACGWVRDDKCECWRNPTEDEYAVAFMNGSHAHRQLPDYLNDLNACREFEKSLSFEGDYTKRNFYAHKLGEITYNDSGRGWKPLSNDDCFPILHATAAQRCEAFLKTLSLWIE